jgi:hypothetical protein
VKSSRKFDKRTRCGHKGMVISIETPPPDDHECGWKLRAVGLELRASELETKLEAVMGEMDALKRQIFGKKSEKMPPMDREVRKQRPADPEATQARRRKNAELRASGLDPLW